MILSILLYSLAAQMIVNLAVGGDWAGAKGIDNAPMPQRLDIGYVRVWK